MQKHIMMLLVVATAGIAFAAPNASAQSRGDQGGQSDHDHGHADRKDPIDRTVTHRREKIIWVRNHGECGYKKIRLYDDEGNIYVKRVRLCDRERILEF